MPKRWTGILRLEYNEYNELNRLNFLPGFEKAITSKYSKWVERSWFDSV
jgi:hypothetical protein